MSRQKNVTLRMLTNRLTSTQKRRYRHHPEPGRNARTCYLKSVLQQIKDGVRPAIKTCFQCLEHCDIKTIPYCITKALVNAAEGDEDNALLFCGSNAYRAEKIEKVDDVMKELVGEL